MRKFETTVVTQEHIRRVKEFEALWGDRYCPLTMALMQEGHTNVKVGKCTVLMDDTAWLMNDETERWVRAWDAGETSEGIIAEFTELPHQVGERILNVVI